MADLQCTLACRVDLARLLVTGGRIGASRHRREAHAVRFRGLKLDFLNLRGASLQDVVFEDCVLGEIDVSDAGLTDVDFAGSRVDHSASAMPR